MLTSGTGRTEYRTGELFDEETSATNIPQEDPQDFQADALTERLELMRKGGQVRGYNNTSIYGA